MAEQAISNPKDTNRSTLSGTDAENITLDKKVVSKDEKDELQSTTTKPNILAIYTAYMNQTDGKIDSAQDKKGKEIELKPDCGKLADGMNKTITDDELSEIYDNILKQLGLEQKEPRDIPDHLNPFKCGYLKAKPPPETESD